MLEHNLYYGHNLIAIFPFAMYNRCSTNTNVIPLEQEQDYKLQNWPGLGVQIKNEMCELCNHKPETYFHAGNQPCM